MVMITRKSQESAKSLWCCKTVAAHVQFQAKLTRFRPSSERWVSFSSASEQFNWTWESCNCFLKFINLKLKLLRTSKRVCAGKNVKRVDVMCLGLRDRRSPCWENPGCRMPLGRQWNLTLEIKKVKNDPKYC